MGSCNIKGENLQTSENVCASNFRVCYVLGQGGFGKVWKVELKNSKDTFAMKKMSKARIIAKKSVTSVLNERKVLSILHHSFIINMHYAFQDRENLYLILDFLSGGDLRYYLSTETYFSEVQAQFMTACLITGLEYLHGKGIIHRDIKPENLVFDEKGYLIITDFGVARSVHDDNSKESSGTQGYMAPEVMCHQDHGTVVDYFALGVILYEIMLGKRPYTGNNRKEIRDNMLSKQVFVTKNELPFGWSIHSADFVNKLLKRRPEFRLGKNGVEEVKSHPWVKDINWKRIYDKTLISPFDIKEESEIKNRFRSKSWNDDSEAIKKGNAMLLKQATQELFSEYYYESLSVISSKTDFNQ